MKRVFVDSRGFFALLAAEDRFHDHARSLFSRANAERWRLVTTNAARWSQKAARSSSGHGDAARVTDTADPSRAERLTTLAAALSVDRR